MAKTQAKAKPANPPVAHVRIKNVQGSIWENATERGVFRNVTFDRSFRGQDGNWAKTRGFDLDALLALSKAVDLAIDKLLALKAQDQADPDQADGVHEVELDEDDIVL